MAYRKKTLRQMRPITRRYARILNELDGVLRRLKNLTEEIARLESDSTALFRQSRQAGVEKSEDLEEIFPDG